jgi:hypothetical protein
VPYDEGNSYFGFRVRFFISDLLACLLGFLTARLDAEVPMNDNFEAAITLSWSGDFSYVHGSTHRATVEAGEETLFN